MTRLVGLFSRTPRELQIKDNMQKFKESKKLGREKKYTAARKWGTEYVEKSHNNKDILMMEVEMQKRKNKKKTDKI